MAKPNSDAEKLSRPMCFEGSSGWLKPFGYISTSPEKLAVFELNTMLDFDSAELVKLACRMSAANELLAAAKRLSELAYQIRAWVSDQDAELLKAAWDDMDAAINKAEGR